MIKTISKTAMIAGFALLFGRTAVEPCLADKSRPNIVFVLTDDQGYGDAGCHGNPILITPNIDRLHSQSVRFTDFQVSPSCAPTRCSLMTGMHEFKSGVTHTVEPWRNMNKESYTIAQALKSADYVTGIFGKWHLGLKNDRAPHKRGFDVSLTAQGDNQNSHVNPTLMRNGRAEKMEGFRTDILFDEAMRFIEDNKDKSFFCYLPTYSPHEPLKCPEEYSAPYKETCNEKTQNFFGMIGNIDHNLGRLMEHLDKLSLAENTLVVFMNDNGATNGTDVWNAGMRGTKGTTWRGGVRAMSFWRWPGQFKPASVNDLTTAVDLYPTLLELAGVKAFDTLDGISLVPLLEGGRDLRKYNDRYVFTHRGRWSSVADPHKYTTAGIRWNKYTMLTFNGNCGRSKCPSCKKMRSRKTWKYSPKNMAHHFKFAAGWELYDLSKDPEQNENIAVGHEHIVADMKAAYDSWWDEVRPLMINEKVRLIQSSDKQ